MTSGKGVVNCETSLVREGWYMYIQEAWLGKALSFVKALFSEGATVFGDDM